LTLNQPYLWYGHVSDNLFAHVNKGSALWLKIEDAKRGDEVYILDGSRNRGAGDDGGFGGTHVEMIRGGDVETAERSCGRMRETPSQVLPLYIQHLR
jgi:hypothetical protein